MTLTATPEIKGILARDLVKDAVKRSASVITAIDVIPRSGDLERDARLKDAADLIKQAHTQLMCWQIEGGK